MAWVNVRRNFVWCRTRHYPGSATLIHFQPQSLPRVQSSAFSLHDRVDRCHKYVRPSFSDGSRCSVVGWGDPVHDIRGFQLTLVAPLNVPEIRFVF